MTNKQILKIEYDEETDSLQTDFDLDNYDLTLKIDLLTDMLLEIDKKRDEMFDLLFKGENVVEETKK